MRSKAKARKLTQDESPEPTDFRYSPSMEQQSTDMTYDMTDKASTSASPSPPPSDAITSLPPGLELRPSQEAAALGVWTKTHIPKGAQFGFLVGETRPGEEESGEGWEVVDEHGKAGGWLDITQAPPGPGSWMKCVRNTHAPNLHNVMAVEIRDQVFYRSIRDIPPSEEMLLFANDPIYREKPSETFAFEDEKQFPCAKCGELFRSKVALRRHETYVCNNSNAIFATLNRQFKESQAAVAAASASASTASVLKQIPASVQHQQSGPLLAARLARAGRSQEAQSVPESEMIEDNVHQRQFVSERCLPSPPSPLSPLSQLHSLKQDTDGEYGKQFPCENCDKVFTDPSNLQRHIRSTHVGARSHACPDCGKTFATSSGLKQHQHIHSSVKPFQCEVCLKAYTQFSNLCRHKRMHADCRQQIKCKDCGQAFSTMTSLSKHKRFCEGMLRNGARYPFQSPHNVSAPEKPTPVNPTVSQSPALSAAAYMNYYNPRPPFPFYTPLAPSFPMFPPGHPLAALTPPVLPDAKVPMCTSQQMLMASSPTSASTPKAAAYGAHKYAAYDSPKAVDGSDLSDISQPNSDMDSHGSDADSESEQDRSIRGRASSHGSRGSSQVPQLSVPVSRLLNNTTPSVSPGAHSASSPAPNATDSKRKSSSDSGLLDLSKSSSGSSELPLDLSTKIKEITPEKTPRKTHIFGGDRRPHRSLPSPVEPVSTMKMPSPATKKLHQAYPSPMPTSVMEMYKMDKEKLASLQERAVRMMSMQRFPMPAPPMPHMQTMHGMMPHRNPFDPTKVFHPVMKLDVSPDGFPFHHGNKIKDRYSCKFCGKIFPRSANLTRHLRTHTGEQPYKCKYCERSFSISSNLQRHVRNIHNKEKPFKCPLCDRCFGQQTNLDRHLKKHESEGPNVIDSPPPGSEHELDEKEESYFDEIRNFIGKATSDERDPRGFMNIDSNFSITAQIEKQSQLKVIDKVTGLDAEDDEDLIDDEIIHPDDDEDDDVDEDELGDDLVDDDDELDGIPMTKRARLDNNNDDSGVENDRLLSNGFHSTPSELSKHLSGHYDVKSLTTPLTIST